VTEEKSEVEKVKGKIKEEEKDGKISTSSAASE
jgi:hypothetical protein